MTKFLYKSVISFVTYLKFGGFLELCNQTHSKSLRIAPEQKCSNMTAILKEQCAIGKTKTLETKNKGYR